MTREQTALTHAGCRNGTGTETGLGRHQGRAGRRCRGRALRGRLRRDLGRLGLSLLQTCLLSLLVFTGASQFTLVAALAAGGSPFAAAAGAFFLGVRNTFYGLRLSQLLALPRAIRPFAAHWVIDETTAVTLAQPTRRAARIGFTTTGLTLYVLWNLTTLLGALGAEALGDTAAWGLDAAAPAVFLALLAPMLRTTTERAVAGLAVVLGLGLLPVLPGGVPVLIAALAAPAVLLFEGRAAWT